MILHEHHPTPRMLLACMSGEYDSLSIARADERGSTKNLKTKKSHNLVECLKMPELALFCLPSRLPALSSPSLHYFRHG
jgi:hypothetical protein